MPNMKSYFSGHLVLPHLELAFGLMLRAFSPELVMVLEFEFRTSLGTSIFLSITNGSKVIAKVYVDNRQTKKKQK